MSKLIKKTLKGIEPTSYRLNHNTPYHILLRNIERPFFAISDEVLNQLDDRSKFENDIILYKGRLCTFGGRSGDYHLMPIINKDLLIDTKLL
jgi:hypothetical protein